MYFNTAALSQCVGHNARLVECPLSRASILCMGVYKYADMTVISYSLYHLHTRAVDQPHRFHLYYMK